MRIYIIFSILSISMIFNVIAKNNKIIDDSDKILLKKTFNLDIANKKLSKNLLAKNDLSNSCYVLLPKKFNDLMKRRGIDLSKKISPAKINLLKIPKGWGVSYYNFFVKNTVPSKLDFTKEHGKKYQ